MQTPSHAPVSLGPLVGHLLLVAVCIAILIGGIRVVLGSWTTGRPILRLTALTILGVGAYQAFDSIHPSWMLIALVWLVVGFVVFVRDLRERTSAAREALARRIEQARGHERKRVPPPLLPHGHSSQSTGTRPSTP